MANDISPGVTEGSEIDYAEWTSGDITLSGSTQTIVAGNKRYYDGSPVMIETFIPKGVGSSPNCSFFVTMDGSSVQYMGQWSPGGAILGFYGIFRYTPTPGFHTFSFLSQLNGGSGTLHGSRTGGDYVPIFIRVTKA